MKRAIGVLCAAALALALGACGGGAASQQSSGEPSKEAVPANSLEELIQQAQTDFSDTSQKLLDEQEKLFSEAGDTYEDYLENVDAIQAWYDLAVSETEALGGRAIKYGRDYYQLVVDNVDVTDDRELDRATEEFYDAIYEDAFEDYYDAIYEDAFDEMYDTYYDGIIDDAYDTTPYDEWSDAHGDAYDSWSDAHSDVYDAWSDSRSDVYSDYSDVRSAFYSNDFDVEGIFAPVQVKDEADKNEPSEAEVDDTDVVAESDGAVEEESDTSAVDPDFKAMMDEYEAFFDEYVEFMQAYSENPTSAELMGQYSDLMSQYAETMNSMAEIDTSSLSPADSAYYLEVTSRIYEKVGEIS